MSGEQSFIDQGIFSDHKKSHKYAEIRFNRKFYLKYKDLINKYFEKADLGFIRMRNTHYGVLKGEMCFNIKGDWYGRDLIEPVNDDANDLYTKLVDAIYKENAAIAFSYVIKDQNGNTTQHGTDIIEPKDDEYEIDQFGEILPFKEETDNFYIR